MASNITLSAGVRQNLLALQNTAALLSSTQNRLATGKKVNTALDNPTNFFTSSALSARASDLSSLLDSMSNGIQTIQAANNGLTSITNVVNSMQATITQARQDSSFKSASYTIDTATIGTSTAKTLSISGGAVGSTPVTVSLNATGTAAHQASVTQASNYVAPTAGSAATHGILTATGTIGTAGDIDASGGAITFDVNGQTVTLSTTGGTSSNGHYSLSDLESAINTQVGSSASVNATDDGSGHLILTSTGTAGASDTVTVDNFSGSNDASLLGYTAGASASASGSAAVIAQTLSFTINGTAITLDSTSNATTGGDTGAHAAQSINAQLTAASVTGLTATFASGKLTIAGASNGTNNVTIAGTDASALFGSTLIDNGTAAGGGSVQTVDQLVTAINGNSSLTGKVKASNDNGKLSIQNLSTDDLTLTGATSTSVDGGSGTQTVGGNSVRKNLITQFNDLRSQLDKLADDSSFNGTNLLHGDTLKLVFNETNTSSISIVSQNANGINSSVLNIGTASAAEFSSNATLDTRQDALHEALTQLRSQSSAFGSNLSVVQNRQDFTKSMINTLQTGSDNLTLADSNEEAANLLALQTRQQLSTTALSLAAQSDQAVLRLF